MDIYKDHGDFFLISSWSFDAGDFFIGQSYINSDYVSGARGASHYYRQRGRRVFGGQDGCYVVGNVQDEVLRIECDAYGLMPILYYQKDNQWAVSNSFLLLAEHLAANGVRLKPDHDNISVFSDRRARNPISFRTAVQEIRLAASHDTIRVTRNRLELVPRLREPTDHYAVCMHQALSTWLSRIVTLAKDGRCNMKLSLSGGIDSRVVLAMLLHLRERGWLDRDMGVRVATGTAAHHDADFRVVSQLSDAFDFKFNEGTANPTGKESRRLSADQSFTHWRLSSLGIYSRPATRSHQPDPFDITLGGHGGLFYFGSDAISGVRAIVTRETRKTDRRRITRRIRLSAQVWSCLRELTSRNGNEIALNHAYFKELRSRMHHGASARRRPSFYPLVGKDFERAFRALDRDSRVRPQMHTDAILNLQRQLFDIPLDRPQRKPGQSCYDNNQQLPDFDIEPGLVFAGQPTVVTPHRAKSRYSFVERLASEVDDASATYLDQSFGDRARKSLAGQIDSIVGEASTKTGRKGIELMHAAYLAKEVERLTRI